MQRIFFKIMKFIGVTGGVGAGKSEVLSYLDKREDSFVLYSDRLAENESKPGGKCYEKIREAFPCDSLYKEDGTMDRKAFAREVFSDEKKRYKLDNIIHPKMREIIMEDVEKKRAEGSYEYYFLEAALLIEENYPEILDSLWYIYAPIDVRRQRLKASRNYSDEKIDSILRNQLDDSTFRKYADVVIDNGGDFSDTKITIENLLEK